MAAQDDARLAHGRVHLVVGIGSPWRGDDAAGLLVAERLAAMCLAGVEIKQCDCLDLRLLDLWRADQFVILVDALVTGAAPGTIQRVDLLRQPLPRGLAASTHSLDLATVLELARLLKHLPRQLLLYGIEAGSFDPNGTPGAAVVSAIDECAKMIAGAITWPAEEPR